MHESGVIERLLRAATEEAARHGGRLRAVQVRLGMLAGGSPEHLREHFEQGVAALGLAPVRLDVEHCPEYPGGVEIVSIELARRP